MRNITIEKDIKREKISVKISHEKSFDTNFTVFVCYISVVCTMRQGDLYWRRNEHSKYLNWPWSSRMWILHQHDPIPSQIIEKVENTNILFTVWISYCSTHDIQSYIVSLRWRLKALESITVKGKKCFPTITANGLATFDSLHRLQLQITHSSRYYNHRAFYDRRSIMRNPRFKVLWRLAKAQ